ncbi:MAG: glycosyltransferase [Ignavibacteria bacterium]|nr:glycosyltransferase [Ignavibacteria bacterium]
MAKILHIAPQNTAGMPMDFVKMHKQFGFESNLVTIYKNKLNFEEDISLNLELPQSSLAKKWRDKKVEAPSETKLKEYKPKNIVEEFYFSLRDSKNKKKINELIEQHNLFDYDIFHFDGGMDFFRNISFAKELKKRNKKIVCCYFGSDLRTRGIFKELEDISDLLLTVEYDHLLLHKNVNYIYFPFDVKKFEFKLNNNKIKKIIHSPTNRAFKGTEKIIPEVTKALKEINFEFILLENIDREELLKIKSSCDLAIDQVGGEMGGSGYGKNSIENLSMGIPTFTEFFDDYYKFIGDNPFINSNISNLKNNIVRFVIDEKLIEEYAIKGRKWVEDTHSFEAVNEKLMSYYKKFNII